MLPPPFEGGSDLRVLRGMEHGSHRYARYSVAKAFQVLLQGKSSIHGVVNCREKPVTVVAARDRCKIDIQRSSMRHGYGGKRLKRPIRNERPISP